jgi:hypothetical protein
MELIPRVARSRNVLASWSLLALLATSLFECKERARSDALNRWVRVVGTRIGCEDEGEFGACCFTLFFPGTRVFITTVFRGCSRATGSLPAYFWFDLVEDAESIFLQIASCKRRSLNHESQSMSDDEIPIVFCIICWIKGALNPRVKGAASKQFFSIKNLRPQ